MPPHEGPQGKHQVGSGGGRSGKKMWARTFIMFSTRRTWQCRISRLRLVSLGSFSGLWGIEATPGCLVLGPGIIRGRWIVI